MFLLKTNNLRNLLIPQLKAKSINPNISRPRKNYLLAYISHSSESTRSIKADLLNFERSSRSKEQSPFSSHHDLPFVKEYQQTLCRDFVLGGIGLHSAEYAHIRVRPASAGDGRYFVIVPKGTISDCPTYDVERKQLEDAGRGNYENEFDKAWNSRIRDHSVESFLAYHEAKTKGYHGSIEEFEEEFYCAENQIILSEMKRRISSKAETKDTKVIPMTQEEIIIPASLEFACGEVNYTALSRNGHTVRSVEHILSALEACGVDNCRIEIEGGREIPVIDGSAYGWTTLIIRVGVIQCLTEAPKGILKVHEPIVVTGENGSFVSGVPSSNTLISAGWDGLPSGASCFGRSWYTWCMNEDFHFHFSVAPAKTFYHSEFELDALYDSGLVQAGPSACAIVGMGETFQNPGEVTFPDDEASRHKVIDFVGDLSLLSSNGQGGIPVGHFVAWNADHVLQIKFCIRLWNELLDLSDNFLTSYTPCVKLKS
jgi:UDP-3-O-acyl-N-acetylglucosamine deacetylase